MNILSAPPTDIFRALADRGRLRVILLLGDNELCVCDLTQVLQMPQSTISRHMSRLKSAGLVADRRDGKWVHYRLLTDSPIRELMPFLTKLREQEPHRDDLIRLAEYRRGRCCR